MVDSAPVREGDVLAGKYRVERVIGSGGMGVVVAALHITLHQRVALKFMLPDALANTQAVGRFVREARAVARLKSEHIARVVDVGTLETGAPYMVMEFLEGKDLGALVETGGPLPVAVAIDYILQACEALAEAHAMGIVHRDIKPQNLFLTAGVDGRPLIKVLDFGVSKDHTDNEEAAKGLTSTHTFLGSPHFMSPEQLKNARDVDARADIWGLGACLYELLVGRVPFDAPSLAELSAKVLMEPVEPMHPLRPEVPAAVEAVVMQCLEKQRHRRFPNVGALAEALEPFAPPSRRSSAKRVRSVLSVSSHSSPGTPLPHASLSSSDAGNAAGDAGSDPSVTVDPPTTTGPRFVTNPSGTLPVVATLAGERASRPRGVAYIAGGAAVFVGLGIAVVGWRAVASPRVTPPAVSALQTPPVTLPSPSAPPPALDTTHEAPSEPVQPVVTTQSLPIPSKPVTSAAPVRPSVPAKHSTGSTPHATPPSSHEDLLMDRN